MTAVAVALLVIGLAGAAGTGVLIIVGRAIMSRVELRDDVKRWTDDHIAEAADVLKHEDALTEALAMAALEEVEQARLDLNARVKAWRP